MKNRTLLLAIILTFFMASCKTVDINKLVPSYKISKPLPNMEIMFDLDGLSTQNVYNTTDETGNLVRNVSLIEDKETISYLKRDISDNIIDNNGEKKGKIIVRRDLYMPPEHSMSFMFFSAVSFGLLNLVGLPFDVIRSQVVLTLEITDNNDKIIGKYTGVGKARTAIGLFGYVGSGVTQYTKIKACEKAMTAIKKSIEKDADRLIKELK